MWRLATFDFVIIISPIIPPGLICQKVKILLDHFTVCHQKDDTRVQFYRTFNLSVVKCRVSFGRGSAVSTRRHLRSAGQGDLVVPRTRTTGFSVAGSLAWNSLPPEIKTTSLTLGQFSGRLKTEMFIRSLRVSAAVIIFL